MLILFLVEYPIDLWISTSFTSFLASLSTIFSVSKYSLSFKSICSYFIPNAFSELGPGFSPIPITVCNVS